MKKIKLINVFSGLILSILAVAGPGFSMVLYDDFSGTYLDEMKWEHVEFVREIDAVSQKFVSKLASPNPITATGFPYSTYNNLPFSDPNSVNSIRRCCLPHLGLTNTSANKHLRAGFGWPGSRSQVDLY